MIDENIYIVKNLILPYSLPTHLQERLEGGGKIGEKEREKKKLRKSPL